MNSTTSFVHSVFKSCWQSFYAWKEYHDAEIMDSLMRDVHLTDDPTSITEVVDDPGFQSPAPAPHFNVTIYDSDDEIEETYTLPIETINVEVTKPHPEYTSCTPLTRSTMVGDDSNYMTFIPYSDDPTFNHQAQTLHYDHFAWQNIQDPDVEVICAQAVKMLMKEHGLTLQQILDTKVMPPNIIQKITSLLGARRRDYPEWPPDDPLHSTNVPYQSNHTNASPSQTLQDIFRYFCTASCLHGYCSVHTDEVPLPPPLQPTLTNENLYSTVEEPCSKNCFILGRHTNSLSYWSDEDLDILHTTLKYGPDSLPCDLAIIVRKPCNETAGHRQKWLASQPPIPTTQNKPPSRPLSRKNTGTTKIEFHDFDSDNFTPKYPCSHSGPCDFSTNCPCTETDAHCIGSCKCPQNCIRKWRGCTCTKSTKTKVNRTCGTYRCPCFRAHRECDPELCVKCDARDPKADVCRNSSIQHMQYKRGVVFRSKWGLGYYLLEPACEGELVTEYIGDLIYDLTTKSRDPVAAHVQRQYMFKLNSTLSVDGSTAGNESRYINHAPGDRANVRAHVRFVNGEHRIGIYAAKDIERGQELLLDYGSDFFDSSDSLSHSTSSQIHSTPKSLSSDSPQILSTSLYHQPQSPTPQQKAGTKVRRKMKTKMVVRRSRRQLTNLSPQDEDDGSEYEGSGGETGSQSD